MTEQPTDPMKDMLRQFLGDAVDSPEVDEMLSALGMGGAGAAAAEQRHHERRGGARALVLDRPARPHEAGVAAARVGGAS